VSIAAIAAIIGLGIGVAANPAGISLVILLLMSRDGMRKAIAYVVGSLLAETAIISAVLLFIREADKLALGATDLSPGPNNVEAWVIALAGGLLVLTGIWMLRRGSVRAGALVRRAMRNVDSTPAWLAFAVGAVLVSWTMPVLAAAEMEAATPGALTLIGGLPLYLVFMALALSTVLLPIVLVAARPDRARGLLERAHAWLARNGAVVAAVTTMVFGIVFAARGIIALLS
jgi:Sap, sulfolipid-1-addressing protein